MCHVVRQQQPQAQPGTTPPSLQSPRPRSVAIVAAMLIGGVAVAALVTPSSSPPPVATARSSAALLPVASRLSVVPTTASREPGSAPVDDGVPTASDMVKADGGHCHHGM